MAVYGIGRLLLPFPSPKRMWRAAKLFWVGENCVTKTEDGVDAGSTDIIIVGAGVAGAALAYALGKDGRRVHLIERDMNPPDRIAGEALLPGGYVNVNLEKGTVTSLLEENGTVKGVQYRNKKGEELTANAPLTIVCDGGFSNLRRSLCYSKVDTPSYFVGLVLENCKLPHDYYGAFILADPSPILFYPIGSTEIRCLVDVPSHKVPSVSDGEMSHFLKTVVAPKVLPVLPEMYTAFISAIDKPNNIRTMPNRSMPASPVPTPGALLMGDAFNMRHPFTGSGMTVALSDATLVRDLLRPLHNLSDASAVCKYLESFYILRQPMAFTLNTLGNTLHSIFSASPSDPTMDEMQHACFGYMSLGGLFTNGLSAPFSGLYPRPLNMVFHILAMAIYGVGRLLLPFPSPKRMWRGAQLIWVRIFVTIVT
ncbi:FAD dependent oxidoreductase [Corchorus olitorius]|uniref:Squalene monooxygenase n=1 Tax=Corchorus olitorius TaxID=93759 RepID=A0A1R3JBH7_9ROSI|nr:FAD dependent oxidoreductase [Corchorus olitorius]